MQATLTFTKFWKSWKFSRYWLYTCVAMGFLLLFVVGGCDGGGVNRNSSESKDSQSYASQDSASAEALSKKTPTTVEGLSREAQKLQTLSSERDMINRRLRYLLGDKVDLSCALALPINILQIQLGGVTASGKAIEEAAKQSAYKDGKYMRVHWGGAQDMSFVRTVESYGLFDQPKTFSEPIRRMFSIVSIKIVQDGEGYFDGESHWTLKSLKVTARDIVIYEQSDIDHRFAKKGDAFEVTQEQLKANAAYKAMQANIDVCAL